MTVDLWEGSANLNPGYIYRFLERGACTQLICKVLACSRLSSMVCAVSRGGSKVLPLGLVQELSG